MTAPSKSRLMYRAMLCLMAGAVVSSCVLNEPQDLRFEDLSVVSLAEEPQLMDTGVAYIDGDPARAKLLKIAFSSQTDLVRFHKERGYQVSYAAHGCASSSLGAPEYVTTIDLRVGNDWLDGGAYIAGSRVGSGGSLEAQRRSDGRIVYFAAIPIDGKEMRSRFLRSKAPESETRRLYDPARDSSDVCLTLRGGQMLGGTLISPPLVIPRARISSVVGGG